MNIKTEIQITPDEIIELIKEKYNVDGEFTFIINEEVFKSGYNDVGICYSTRNIFNGVKIMTN